MSLGVESVQSEEEADLREGDMNVRAKIDSRSDGVGSCLLASLLSSENHWNNVFAKENFVMTLCQNPARIG